MDVAALLQTEDLFQTGESHCPAPVPDLAALAPLPCCHPCSPLPDPALKGADGSWPTPPVEVEAPSVGKKTGAAASDTVKRTEGLLSSPRRLREGAVRGAAPPRLPGVALPPLSAPR